MAERVRVRELSNDEGDRLLRIVRRDSGSVVTWRRAQMVLLSAQGMDADKIAAVTFAATDRVRDVVHNFNRDGFDALYPRYAGGRPPTFTLPQRQGDQEDRAVPPGRPRPAVLDVEPGQAGRLPPRQGGGRRHQLRGPAGPAPPGGRVVPSGEDVRAAPTTPTSKPRRTGSCTCTPSPTAPPGPARTIPTWCSARVEFGPPDLQPHPAERWAAVGGRHRDPDRPPRRRRRATYTRPHGVRHLLAAYDLGRDKLYGHAETRKGRTEFLAFCRYLRSLYPPEVRIAIVLDNFSPHLSTKTDQRVGEWAEAKNVELAYTPTYSAWLTRIEAQFTALRYFTLDGTDHASHAERAA